ncbi:MAG TPA: copper amine oxidase N-terminal domain-containing protein [bacterium]|nr:copper amine oxidase N-terminal domain-containing protein [bacterium]
MSALRFDRRKRVLLSAFLAVAAGLTSVAAAQTPAPYVKIVVDGNPIYLDAPPVIVNGRVLVPLRGVFERLGATVLWDAASQTVRAQRGPIGVALTIGASQAVVNGQPQSLDSPALLVGGRTMVPLRFISQALGAAVGWDAGSYTVQIASQGAAAPPVAYPPAPPPLPAPPANYPPAQTPQPVAQTVTGTVTQVNASAYPGQLSIHTSTGTDATYRIVSGTTITRTNSAGLNDPVSLSAIRPGDAVTVTADQTGTAESVQALNYAPAEPPQGPAPPAAQTVAGTVTQVTASAYPGQLSVQASNGTVSTYRIVSGTAITRTNTTTGLSGPVPLNALQPGDAVTVTADQAGTAQIVQVSFAEINDTIASSGPNQVVLRGGQTYTLAPAAQVIRGGQLVPATALQPGDVVTLRVNPETRQVYAVTVQSAASAGAITAITVTPAGRPLAAGDVMTVVATGPARGTATFTIAGLWAGLPMTESATQPGTYVGTYAVRPGDYVANGSVVISVTAPNGQLLTATAPVPVSINGVATGPSAAAGAPAINTPTANKAVTTPFTVTGTAPPRSQVKVTADYRKSILLVNVHGTLGSQTVTADENGNWSATFNQKPPVRGVNLTVTAVLVDRTGAVSSPPAIVTTTLQ